MIVTLTLADTITFLSKSAEIILITSVLFNRLRSFMIDQALTGTEINVMKVTFILSYNESSDCGLLIKSKNYARPMKFCNTWQHKYFLLHFTITMFASARHM